jgi:TetR/AcrR family acrAB operon transcriptional repressor
MVRKTKEEADLTRRQIIDAARRVFLEFGVSHTTLEKIAATAGVTRGAVYWHFRNKTELFFAMREQAILPFVDRVVFKEDDSDPLDGIETALREIFHILGDQPEVRETFEIISFKCEYVNELGDMMQCTGGQLDFLGKLTEAYRRAEARGVLRPGIAPDDLAHDTFLFVGGLIKHWLAGRPDERFRADAAALIRTHVALRRAGVDQAGPVSPARSSHLSKAA